MALQRLHRQNVGARNLLNIGNSIWQKYKGRTFVR